MGLTSFIRKVTDRIAGVDSKFNSAIIVAAGSGTRASTAGTTKQMMPLLGIPVVARTVSVFEDCGFINEIIIVAKSDELRFYEGIRLEKDRRRRPRKGNKTAFCHRGLQKDIR